VSTIKDSKIVQEPTHWLYPHPADSFLNFFKDREEVKHSLIKKLRNSSYSLNSFQIGQVSTLKGLHNHEEIRLNHVIEFVLFALQKSSTGGAEIFGFKINLFCVSI